MTMNPKLQDMDAITPDEVRAALRRNSRDELALVSITVALLSPDLVLAQQVCLRLCSHDDCRIRGHAVMSLGHLARRFRMLDEKNVKPVIEAGLTDPNEYVRIHAQSAADEIHQFLGWDFKGHSYGI